MWAHSRAFASALACAMLRTTVPFHDDDPIVVAPGRGCWKQKNTSCDVRDMGFEKRGLHFCRKGNRNSRPWERNRGRLQCTSFHREISLPGLPVYVIIQFGDGSVYDQLVVSHRVSAK